MPSIEPVGSGKTVTHWNCSDCSFWSKDSDDVAKHIVDVHGGSARNDAPALADMTKAQLIALADELGLEHTKKPANDVLIALIEDEQKRLADEAAAAQAATEASSSGEGNEGGDGQPGDDPEASSSGEPGTPPAEEVS